ncbi:uncharacterized protein LOC106096463 isoform X2 [Oreochromis niloticus]|uniref:uncharacterized protein LOC106096463 isoform X2 n=1 Tax=Oreochromis niloticus TaxID=8128 RepID=UPI00090539D4|nr:uncharacterized protein LOC106096463 isoform X2 [Oreochromis niloticus]
MGRHILLKGLQMYLLQTLGFAWLIFGFSTDCVSAAGANAASRNDCGQDCSETQYDTQEAARSGNKFHPGASLSCCGKEPYNPEVATCCKVQDGNKAFDKDKQLCCGASDKKTILVRNSTFHWCCGHNQYDNRTQCCCENKEGVLEVQPKNSSCCDKNSTTGVHHVGNLHCGPNDNKKSLVRNSSFHQCCGHNQYDNRTQCCCENKEGVLEVQLKNSSCCDKSSTAGVHNVGNLRCGPNDDKKSLVRNSSFHQCCGHNQYDNRTQCCCENKEGVLEVQPKNSSCCDKNSTTGVHHVGNLHCGPNDNKKSLVRNSSFHQCCGHNQYDNRTQCCCENKEGVLEVQLKNSSCCDKSSTAGVHNVGNLRCGPNDDKKSLVRNSSFHQCCGHNQYDNRTQCCCENKEGVLEVQPKNSSCCDKNSTTGVHHVGNLLCGPNDNKKSLVRNSSFHQCCGHNQYDNRTQCCCENKEGVLEVQLKNSSCCDKSSTAGVHNVGNLRCGPNDNKKSLVRNSSFHQCCGHNQYDNRTQCCCENKEGVLEVQPKNSSCCDKNSTTGVHHVGNLLCGPNDNKKSLVRNSSFHQCCGHNQYDNRTQCCCENKEGVLEIQPKHSDCCAKESVKPEGFRQLTHRLLHCCTEPNTHLCGSTCYNPKTHRCCERHQKPFWFCASGKRKARVYDPRIEVCCDGSVSPWKPWIDQCCGVTVYGSAQRGVLCCNNTLYEGRDDGEECSEVGIPYNPAKGTLCCSQFHGSPGQHCCGTEIYRPRTEICCNGHRHPKSENLHCCGVKAYNIKDPQMKCCAGTLYNLTSLDKHGGDAQCCGSILQKPQDICCSSQKKEMLYSVKTGFGCCGHLYYNTTLWSCCAGRLRSIHEPGQDQRKMTHGSRLLSLNNLNTSGLCKEMYTGTVESVSVKSVVFRNVLKVHGNNVTALPLHYILDIDDHCQSPKLFLGKTYIFNKVNVFTDFNHDSVLQSLHFIFSKCSS